MRRCCACICSGDQTRSLNMQRQADDTDARAAAQPAAARGPRRGALLHFSWAGRGGVWRAGYMTARASLGWIPHEGDTLHVVIKAWGKRPVVRLSAAVSGWPACTAAGWFTALRNACRRVMSQSALLLALESHVAHLSTVVGWMTLTRPTPRCARSTHSQPGTRLIFQCPCIDARTFKF